MAPAFVTDHFSPGVSWWGVLLYFHELPLIVTNPHGQRVFNILFSRIATYRNLLPRSNVVKIVVNVVKVFKGKPSDLCHSVYRLGNFQFALQTLGFLLLELFCYIKEKESLKNINNCDIMKSERR